MELKINGNFELDNENYKVKKVMHTEVIHAPFSTYVKTLIEIEPVKKTVTVDDEFVGAVNDKLSRRCRENNIPFRFNVQKRAFEFSPGEYYRVDILRYNPVGPDVVISHRGFHLTQDREKFKSELSECIENLLIEVCNDYTHYLQRELA